MEAQAKSADAFAGRHQEARTGPAEQQGEWV